MNWIFAPYIITISDRICDTKTTKIFRCGRKCHVLHIHVFCYEIWAIHTDLQCLKMQYKYIFFIHPRTIKGLVLFLSPKTFHLCPWSNSNCLTCWQSHQFKMLTKYRHCEPVTILNQHILSFLPQMNFLVI